MFFRQLLREETGCASYIIGSPDAGACAVIDPGQHVQDYLEVGRAKGMAVAHVLDTHAHADHISGSRALAAATGATIHLHRAYEPRYPHHPLNEGDRIDLGEVTLQVIHAPGHRPDNICLAVSDRSRSSEPWLVLTGDSLFIGDVARPDLGISPAEGAAELYDTLRRKILPLGDGVEVYPAHVAGSACGRAMSAKPVSTIGYERRFNLALQAASQQAFVEGLLRDLPPQPPNFLTIVAKNQGILPVRNPEPHPLPAGEVAAKLRRGVILLDVRSPQAFGAGYINEAINVPLSYGGFASAATWSVPPEEPIVLVVAHPQQAVEAYHSLTSLGLDSLEGYLAGDPASWRAAGLPLLELQHLSVHDLHSLRATEGNGLQLVDVREPGEWAQGHVPGAINIPLRELQGNLGELDRARPVAFICNGGFTSGVAASLVKSRGFPHVFNVSGGTSAWRRAGLDVETRAAIRAGPLLQL